MGVGLLSAVYSFFHLTLTEKSLHSRWTLGVANPVTFIPHISNDNNVL